MKKSLYLLLSCCILVCSSLHSRAQTQFITTIAGNGTVGFGGDGGPANGATCELSTPNNMCVDAVGNIYICDAGNQRVRKINTAGVITTIAGNGTPGFLGDGGAAATCELNNPAGVAVDAAGNVYISDLNNNRVRKINTSGIITTLAGNGSPTYGGDGGPSTASSVALNGPYGLAIDPSNNLYIGDDNNNRVRMINLTSGIISTFAGSGVNGFGGDLTPANGTAVKLNLPTYVSTDAAGNVYITDNGNFRLRKVNTSGIINTIAGNGINGATGDGFAATSCELSYSGGSYVDASGNVYIAAGYNNKVRLITASTGIINTIAGTGTAGYNGDGISAVSAKVNIPYAIALDINGNVIFVDGSNERIRKLQGNNPPSFINGASQNMTICENSTATSINSLLAVNEVDAGQLMTWGQVTGPLHGTINFTYNTTSTGSPLTPAGLYYIPNSGYYGADSFKLYIFDGIVTDYTTIHVNITEFDGGKIVGPSIVYNCNTINLSDALGGGTWSSSNAGVATVNTSGVVSAVSTGYATISYTASVAGCGTTSALHRVSVGTPVITTIAGTGAIGYSGSGIPATSATLRGPHGITTDAAGNIYFADDGNNLVRKISGGIIFNIAGNGSGGIGADGIAATATLLDAPFEVALDASNNIYIGDVNSNRIRRIDATTGLISTVAGTGTPGSLGDGSAASAAQLQHPGGIAFDAAGNLYIADATNNKVRKVSATTGIITTVAGTGIAGTGIDGIAATASKFNNPNYVHIDPVTQNLIITDNGNQKIRMVNSVGYVSTIIGAGTASFGGDGGPATAAFIQYPGGVNYDGAGNIYVADYSNDVIRIVNAADTINTFAGTGGQTGYIGDGGPATAARLNNAVDIAFDPSGNMLIADYNNNVIRKISPVATYVGPIAGPSFVCVGSTITLTDGAAGGTWGTSDGSIAIVSSSGVVTGVAPGNVTVVYSMTNSCGTFQTKAYITVGSPIINTIAGTGTAGFAVPGSPATSSQMHGPSGVAFDAAGNMYFCDYYNNQVEKVSASTGAVTTVAGNGIAGYAGDGSPSTSAAVRINAPSGIAIDGSGNIYIAEYANHVIRKINSAGIISTFMGTGSPGFTPDGTPPLTSSPIYHPASVSVDAAGNVYFPDDGNQMVRKVSTAGVLSTLAGTGTGTYNGDNIPATSASVKDPFGIAVDGAGNVYIADQDNYRIRRIDATTGMITTVAGTGVASYSGDGGAAIEAALNGPTGVIIDPAGNLLIADRLNSAVRKVNMATGIITTVAGIPPTGGYAGDGGNPTDALLNNVPYVNMDAAGNLYISDFNGDRIRKIAPVNTTIGPITGGLTVPLCQGATMALGDVSTGGVWTSNDMTVAGVNAGTGMVYGVGGGTTAITYTENYGCGSLYVTQPVTVNPLPATGIISGPSSMVYLCSTLALSDPQPSGTWSSSNPAVATVSTGGVVTGVTVGYTTISYAFTNSCGIAAATYEVSAGVPYVKTIAGIAGSSGNTGDGSQATAAKMSSDEGVIVDAAGNIYISDYGSGTIRKVNPAGIISTIAGPGTIGIFGDGGPATAAFMGKPIGMAFDASGNLYVCDDTYERVRKINMTTGIITTVAGNGSGGGYNGDNIAATAAQLNGPWGVTFDAAGNMYVSESINNRIRRVDATTGIITTYAGTGTGGYNGDGIPATAAKLAQPSYLRFDGSGNLIFGDAANNRIRSITPYGIISTIAGSGSGAGYSPDGTAATNAKLNFPYGVAIDPAGNVCFADYANEMVRIIYKSTGLLGTILGVVGGGGHYGDGGPAVYAGSSGPQDITFDHNGNMLIAEAPSEVVREISPVAAYIAPITGPSSVCPGNTITLTNATSGGVWSGTTIGVATVGSSSGVVTGVSAGNALISYSVNNSCGSYLAKAYVAVGTPIITTVAGNGTATYVSDGVPATSTGVSLPSHTAMDAAGNLYFGDYNNYRIRKVDAVTGLISTYAGTGLPGLGADGVAATASAISGIASLVFDAGGNLYFADYNDNKIRVINPAGIIQTVAGTGTVGSAGDGGAAATATLNHPWGIAFDYSGNIVFCDRNNNRIRKIDLGTGIITTIAGTGSSTFSGDNGPATAAGINGPCDLATDILGNLYTSDFGSNRIRKISTSGIITTVAGNGNPGFSGDNGPALAARLYDPVGVYVDSAFDLYIGDYTNDVVRKVNPAGIITTIAGIGSSAGYNGDGIAPTTAQLKIPQGVALYGNGDIYISDANNNRVRKITLINPLVAPIIGPTGMCLGGTPIALSDVTTGGTWTSNATAIATIGTSGIVTSAGATGIATISYTVPFGCGNVSAMQTVNIVSVPAITGTPTVCQGSTTLLSNTTSGGTWSSGSFTVATVGSAGLVTGGSPGTAVITYTVGSCNSSITVTVLAAPSAISPSSASVCAGNTTPLTDPDAGGTWSSLNAFASVVGGTVTGNSAGVDVISYTVGSCSSLATVNVLPAPTPISPAAASVCVGLATSLTDPTTGGTWSASNGNASIIGGTVTGNVSGIDTITYAIGGCTTTAKVTVNATPLAITPAGAVSVCVGATTTLSDATIPAGTWTSGAVLTATVDPVSGIVGGISSGPAVISYTNSSGCSVTKTITVSITPVAISPSSSIACIGNQTFLTDAIGGGTWSTTNANASVVGGTVTGAVNGIDTIKYTIGTCSASATVTVNAPPSPVTPAGSINFCVGGGITLGDPDFGGSWTSSNSAVASVGTSSGAVVGVTSGVVNISYTNSLGCSAIKPITVNITPTALSPASLQLCTGTTGTFIDGVGLGTWSSSAGGTASVTGGVVTGVGFGTATITYTIGSCYTTAPVTVNLSPTAGTITGPSSLCVSTPVLYTASLSGGTWSSTNNTIATVGSTGMVMGIGTGRDSIKYSITNGCGTAVAAVTVAVSASPNAGVIVGPSVICAGTFTVLTDTISGGSWASSNASGTVTGTGIFSGIVTGTDTVSYTVTNACGTMTTKKSISIGAYLSAGAITGATTVCQGSSVTLTDLAPSGTWGMSNTSATVAGGVVTGLGAGVDTISYSVLSPTGCGYAVASHVITVSPLPDSGSVTGLATLCAGASFTYTDVAPGGLWNVSNTAATITGWGLLNALTPGTDTIMYSVTNACGTTTAKKVLTIGPAISAGTISGAGSVCAGSTLTLADGAASGVWSSSNASAVVIGGIVTGVGAGADTIAYTVTSSCGMAVATAVVTVNPLPVAGSISGSSALCVGSSSLYTDAAAGGVWSSTDPSVAISGGGLATAVSTGTATINYTVSNVCGSATASYAVTTGVTPDAGAIAGSGSVCVGSIVSLSDGVTGGVWGASNTNATVSGGSVTGVTAGTDVISYTVTTACGTATVTAPITINPLPDAGTIAGVSSVCIGTSTTLTDGAPGGSWSASNTDASVTGGVVTGVAVGTDIISYSVTNACGTASATMAVSVGTSADAGTISGAANVCVGSSITLTDGISGGVWGAMNTRASVSGGVVTGVTAGTDTVVYVVTTSCGSAMAMKVISVDPAASAGTITGALGVCEGASITLGVTGGVPGGTWSATNTKATVTGGIVVGIAVGMDTIRYTVTNACGTATASKVIDINQLPNAGSIAGPTEVCIGASITLADATGGGAWSSGSPATATVSAGVVTGVAAGIATIKYTVSNGCGPRSATHAVTVLSNEDCDTKTNGVVVNQEELKVFPNPNAGSFTMNVVADIDEDAHIIITNITGEKVREFNTTTNKVVELQLNGATGIYFLSATTGHGTYVAKVVID